MSISIYITEDITRTSVIRLTDDLDQEFMDKHEDLLVLACAGDREANQKVYELAIQAGYQEDYVDTTGADVTDIEVVEE